MRTRFGDFHKKDMAMEMDKPKIVGNAIEHYLRICPGIPAIAFCASVKHANNLANAFCEAGIYSQSIDGTLNDYDRRSRILGLANGQIKVLTSCDIVSEGTDIPVVGAAILLRPTQSLGLYLQQVGRGLRPYPGKKQSIILDHVGNVYRHGFPDEVRSWHLNHGMVPKKNGETEVKFRMCEQCYYCFSLSQRICPSCGHEIYVKHREIEEVAGELQAVPHPYDVYSQYKQDTYTNASEIGDCKTLGDFKSIGKDRGYKPSWAHVWFKLYQKQQEKV